MTPSSFLTKLRPYTGILLLAAWLITGLLNFKDYGAGWDEETQRQIGTVTYDFLNGKDIDLESYNIRDHGVAFELILVTAEKIAGYSDKHDIYLLRHLISHLFFLCGACFLFLLVDRIYKNKFLAATGFLMVVMHPVLYAHSFFNSKDLPFLSLLMIWFYVNALWLEKKKIRHTILLGIITGLLINIRATGLFFLVIAAIMQLLHCALNRKFAKGLGLAALFFLFSLVILYLSWPFLWKHPFKNLAWLFEFTTRFPYDGTALFAGKFIKTLELPWYYIPVWFSITTPISYLAFGFVGIGALVVTIIRAPRSLSETNTSLHNFFFAICFFGPLLAFILFHSVVYDAWRHMFFIYPAFALLAVYGLSILWTPGFKKYAAGLIVLYLGLVAWWMIRNHPMQNVYFNPLVDRSTPERLRKQFERDYWGVNYKQAIEYVLAHDDSALIKISSQNEPCDINVDMLPPAQRKRIKMAVISESDYFLTNYRWHPEDYTEEQFRGKEWHSIKVDNNSVNTIFKLK